MTMLELLREILPPIPTDKVYCVKFTQGAGGKIYDHEGTLICTMNVEGLTVEMLHAYTVMFTHGPEVISTLNHCIDQLALKADPDSQT